MTAKWLLIAAFPLYAQGPADFPTFLSDASAAMSAVSASVAGIAQPRMQVSVQDWPLTCASQALCNNLTVINNYADGLLAMHIMHVDANLLFRAMACAPEYAPGPSGLVGKDGAWRCGQRERTSSGAMNICCIKHGIA